MLKESDKKVIGISITDRLVINEKTRITALNDLTNNDGNEDPGSELETVFKNIASPPKGNELDLFTNISTKKNEFEKIHPTPQADEILNPELNSENDM